MLSMMDKQLVAVVSVVLIVIMFLAVFIGLM
jgi:hypothetical protein